MNGHIMNDPEQRSKYPMVVLVSMENPHYVSPEMHFLPLTFFLKIVLR
jgi:hypothetical protein